MHKIANELLTFGFGNDIILMQLAMANFLYMHQLAMTNREIVIMNLLLAEEGKEYIIQRIETDDEELDAFLFSLGCYSGEPITVISRQKGGCVVSIKDGRYNIDNQLAEAILI